MSIREDLHKRAGESTVSAALRAGRTPVIALLHKYGATRASSLCLSALVPYIEEVEALPAADVKVPVEFKIGERVGVGTGFPPRKGTVIGYEVRYIVAIDGYAGTPTYGHSAKRLESLGTAVDVGTFTPTAVGFTSTPMPEALEDSLQWTSDEIQRALKAKQNFDFRRSGRG